MHICKRLLPILLIVTQLMLPLVVAAAPIRPAGPADISGEVHDVRWVPRQKIPALPGMSGSAGRDRVVRAHFIVTLRNISGVSRDLAETMSRYVEWPAGGEVTRPAGTMLLKIDHEDRAYLKKEMKIRVRGYTVRGDEGGTWTSFSGIDILAP